MPGDVIFQPLVRVQKNDDGTYNVKFDWFDSCQGEDKGPAHGLADSLFADVVCEEFMDRWSERPDAFTNVSILTIKEDPV